MRNEGGGKKALMMIKTNRNRVKLRAERKAWISEKGGRKDNSQEEKPTIITLFQFFLLFSFAKHLVFFNYLIELSTSHS